MSYDIQSNNKRIAKNTIMLYIRMGIGMLVGLYTSRVVLQVLGVSDYGIYGVVGGIVAFMGFLNSSMSGATSRFLTYELGKGSDGKLKETFVSSFWVHLIIAVIILILAETVGLWFLYKKLVIPEERMFAAFWVYQLSIAASIVSITQVPYNASIISHEDMDLYAYVEIANVMLKLVIVYLLMLITADKLILYASLYFIVSFGTTMYYRWYCLHHYEESHLTLTWDKEIVNKMLNFCGWDLYGNGCIVGKEQGLAFLINMFFGVTLNAGNAIAGQVSSVISGFSSNITLAVRPQIIKSYAEKDFARMQTLLKNAIKYVFLLQACISVPLIFEMEYIQGIWLGEIPPYAVIFCQIMLFTSIFRTTIIIMNIAIHATGNIRRLSYISGSISLIQLPVIYIILKMGGSPEWCYLTGVIGVVVSAIVDMFIIKHNIPQIGVKFLFTPYISAILIVALIGIIPYVIISSFEASFMRFTLTAFSYISIMLVFIYLFVLNKSMRIKIKEYLSKRLLGR